MITVNFIENGEEKIYRGRWDSTLYREITKEEYDRLSGIENLDKEYSETLPAMILNGYGFYGCGVSTFNGKYWFWSKTGNRCD